MWKIVHGEEIAGDASARRYRRVRLVGGVRAVEVVYPPGREEVLARDLEVRAWLEGRGLRVPRLLAEDVASGRALLEDLGTDDAATVLAGRPPGERPDLAAELVEPLRTLAGIEPARLPPWNEPLGERRLRWELAGFELWFLRYGLETVPPAEVSAWLDRLARRTGSHPQRVCHRDYHLNNLFFLGDGQVGVIDFQDVRLGPDTYDLASLVGERDFPELLGGPGTERVVGEWARRTGPVAGWEGRLRETLAQRALKVLGTFARLVERGDGRYRRWMGPLCERAAGLVAEFGAPRSLVELLLQWPDERG